MMNIKKSVKMLIASIGLTAIVSGPSFAGEPAKSLLTPNNHSLILVDHQP